jgi:hypothetical protein
MKVYCVLYEVRTEYLRILQIIWILQSVNTLFSSNLNMFVFNMFLNQISTEIIK